MSDDKGVRVLLRHRLEYAIIRLVGGLVAMLPYRLALVVGWLVAGVIWFFVPHRVHEAERRIRTVFGSGCPARLIRKTAWISLRNMLFSAVEMIQNHRATPARVNACYVDRSFMKDILDQHKTGRGGLIAVGHMGSWELAAILCHHHGIPIFSLAAAQKNPLTNDYINALRRRPGIDTIARGSGTMKQILSRLKAGGFLAILPDVRSKTPAVAVPFLGGTANIGEGMAAFARHANVPIFPVVLSRQGWSRHEGRLGSAPITPDLTADKDADIRRMTMEVLAVLDQAIRKHPEQWFWFNKRWILDPVES